MFEVCQILRGKWSLHNIAIFHRLGEVRPKEASVVIAVSSEHRKESLEAVQVRRYSINLAVFAPLVEYL